MIVCSLAVAKIRHLLEEIGGLLPGQVGEVPVRRDAVEVMALAAALPRLHVLGHDHVAADCVFSRCRSAPQAENGNQECMAESLPTHRFCCSKACMLSARIFSRQCRLSRMNESSVAISGWRGRASGTARSAMMWPG